MPTLHFNIKPRYADLSLHYGKVPPWLAQRMSVLGAAIIENIVMDYGKDAVLQKLSERNESFKYEGGTVLGKAKKPTAVQ